MPPQSQPLLPSPPLKWAGGKRWLLPHLKPLWEKALASRLVEPFTGGLAVALGLRPTEAVLNDFNPHLINFYQQVQQGLTVEIETANESALYYQHRTRFNELITQDAAQSPEAAQLFYYLNRTGFNGLCRFNQRGLFNVPFGRYKVINYRSNFHDLTPLLGIWQFTQGDFAALSLQAGDLIYADPPYDVDFTQYSAGGFDWEDQQRLVTWLAQHDGPVILSNQATPRVHELYENAGYHITELDAPRRISCTGDRAPAREILATRNL